MQTTATQSKIPPAARVFKSMDPTWPMWGVWSPDYRNTHWFRLKADADRFARTGNDSLGKAVAK